MSRLDISANSNRHQEVRVHSTTNLPAVIERLEGKGLLVESDGAQCVFVDGFFRKDGSRLPMIVQKSDGGYLYHTTDLATLLYRTQEIEADQVMYFTDARQILHFQMLFAVAKKGWLCGG